MRRFFAVISAALAVLALSAGTAAAQSTPVVPGDRLGWNQPATSLGEAAGYTYLIRIDAQPPTVVLPAGVTCVGTASPFLCSVPFPAATPGVDHTVTVAARKVVGTTNVDSPFADPPLVFQLVIVPGTPVNVRRIGGADE